MKDPSSRNHHNSNNNHSIIIGIGALAIIAATACSSTQQKPSNDASYTTHRTTSGTTVRVQPPEPTSTTSTTSQQLVIDRKGDKNPLLTDAQQSSKVPGHPDSRIGEQIRQSLNAEDTLRDVALERVRVVTIDGHVTLSGAVPTIADKVTIEQRVRQVKGVEAVDNQLEVWR